MSQDNLTPTPGHTSAHTAAKHGPPIEWPVSASKPAQNQQASNYARQHVDRAYQSHATPEAETDGTTHTMRDEPYDWQDYHRAWQQYYHQYFYRYYANWWQQQKQHQHGNGADSPSSTQSNSPHSQKQIAKEMREKVRRTVTKRAGKVKSSNHFWPVVAGLSVAVSFLLINYNQILVGAIKQYVAPGGVVTTPVIVEANASTTVGPEPKISIPKIGVEGPVVYDEPRVDEASYQAALERGVVRLGNTADPGTQGNVVIGGHSSNNVFSAGDFKYVFVNLRLLDVGDVVYLNFKSTRYTYKITSKRVVPPTDTSALVQTKQPTVTLFTCDPPGTNRNRLVLQAEQIDPEPAKAASNDKPATQANPDNPLPSVAPSLWDQLFN